MTPPTAAPALLTPVPGPELPPHLAMIPVAYDRPLAETLDYLARCARCGTARLDLTRLGGQLVCADRAVCRG